jgi:hypothetical protein
MKYERPIHHGARESAANAIHALFNESEQFNRRVAFFAGYIAAQQAGQSQQESINFGRSAVRVTQFFGGRLDAILFSRTSGFWGKLMMQFKSYPLKQVEFFMRSLDREQKMKYLALTIAMGGLETLGLDWLLKTFAPDSELTEWIHGLSDQYSLAAFLGMRRLSKNMGWAEIPGIDALDQYDPSGRIAKWFAGPTVSSLIDAVAAGYKLANKSLSEEEANEKAIERLQGAVVRGVMPGGTQIMRTIKAAKEMDPAEDPALFVRKSLGLETDEERKR